MIHVEVESEDCTTSLDARFPDYFWHLRRKYGAAVLPVAVFLKVGLDGLGERVCEITTLGEWVMKLRYWYIGLPALDADVYLNGTNWLGVSLSALMKTPAGERLKVTARALRRLVECPESPARKYLLVECLRAYAPLSGDDRVELTSLLQTPEYQGVGTMIKTIYEEGMEKGQRRAIERMLLRRFKTLSPVAQQRLAAYPAERLDDLSDAILDAKSLKDLGLED